MYISILAKSFENEASAGKETWLNTGDSTPSLELISSEAKHLGSPPWHVRISSAQLRFSGTGERGGEGHGTNYTAEIELTPQDVSALLRFAREHGLREKVES